MCNAYNKHKCVYTVILNMNYTYYLRINDEYKGVVRTSDVDIMD